jgi:hypothetical protein
LLAHGMRRDENVNLRWAKILSCCCCIYLHPNNGRDIDIFLIINSIVWVPKNWMFWQYVRTVSIWIRTTMTMLSNLTFQLSANYFVSPIITMMAE